MFNLRPLHGRIHTCSECRHMFIWFLSPRYFQESTVSYLLSFTHQFFFKLPAVPQKLLFGEKHSASPHSPPQHTHRKWSLLLSFLSEECWMSSVCIIHMFFQPKRLTCCLLWSGGTCTHRPVYVTVAWAFTVLRVSTTHLMICMRDCWNLFL